MKKKKTIKRDIVQAENRARISELNAIEQSNKTKAVQSIVKRIGILSAPVVVIIIIVVGFFFPEQTIRVSNSVERWGIIKIVTKILLLLSG